MSRARAVDVDVDVEVWTVDLDRYVAPAGSYLSPSELSRAARFRFPVDRQRYGAGRGALRTLLAGRLGVAAADIRLGVEPFGKPRLEFPSAALQFNVSHSHQVALIAITTGAPVGVDVERVDASLDWVELAALHFARGEQRAIGELPPRQRLDAFFACWTRKEAVLKALGVGLSMPLSSFEVSVDPDGPARLLWADPPLNAGRWTLTDVRTETGFRAALAAPGPVTVTLRDWNDRPAAG